MVYAELTVLLVEEEKLHRYSKEKLTESFICEDETITSLYRLFSPTAPVSNFPSGSGSRGATLSGNLNNSTMHKPRVAFKLGHRSTGGVQAHTIDLARAVMERGFDVFAALVGNGRKLRHDPLTDTLASLGVSVLHVGARGQPPARLLADMVKIQRWLQAHRIDIFHVQQPWPFGSLGSIVCAKAAGVPVVVSTDHDYPRRAGSLLRWVRGQVDRLIDGVIVVAEHNRQLQLTMTDRPPEKIHKIYNGIDLDRFKPTSAEDRARKRAALQIAAEAPVIGTIGRLAQYKRVGDLLLAAAQLKHDWPDLVVLVAGEGSERESLEAQAAQLGLSGCVRFLNRVPDAAAFMHLLDVFVFPSAWEAFGLVAAEAMACGVPVVCTNVGGLPEVVADGETGLVVPPAAPERLRRAIAQLLLNAAMRQQMALRGQRRVIECKFSTDAMADETVALYRSLLSASVRNTRQRLFIRQSQHDATHTTAPHPASHPRLFRD